jgi:hypothetical protein
MTNEAPQFYIDGLVSKSFSLAISPYIKVEDEEMLLIESILSSLVDNFGNAFAVQITSGFRENNLKVSTTLDITFSSFHWLWDIGKKAAVFEKDMEDFLKITKVSLRGGDGWSNTSSEQTARRYDLVVKDGVYEEKKTSKLTYIIKTIEQEGVFKGTQYPSYTNDVVNF